MEVIRIFEKIGGQQIKHLFKLKNNRKIWTFFTSSTDEIAAYKRKLIFDNQIDCIEQTIKIAIKRNYILFVRIHPNISSKVSTGSNEGELKSLI